MFYGKDSPQSVSNFKYFDHNEPPAMHVGCKNNIVIMDDKNLSVVKVVPPN